MKNKPFNKYLTDDEGIVISTSLNDLNDRLLEIENSPVGLNEQDELLIAATFNDLNTRMLALEKFKTDTEHQGD